MENGKINRKFEARYMGEKLILMAWFNPELVKMI